MHPVRHILESLSPPPLAGFAGHGWGGPRAAGSGRAVLPIQHYYGALRLLAVHLAALRFLRLAIPSLRPLFVPISSGLSWGSSWSFYPGSPAGRYDGDGKVSQVPGEPWCSFAMFSDPGVTRHAEWVQVSLMPGAAPASDQGEGSRRGNFGAQSHSV